MSTEKRSIGKYELRERLGYGNMAEVWKAFDPQLQRYVALKILHADLQHNPEFVTRFEREASVIASLHHPNIVQLHDFQVSLVSGSNVTNACMVMDYIEGQTLANYIAQASRQGLFPPATEIVHLFTSIGLAVDYAHQQGFIHRDIKPSNILLDQRNTTHNSIGEPILTDFGMVKLLGTSTSLLSGLWLGSPFYIAPEQAQGYPGNECSDIYALGVILYELCTGVLPFQGETAPDILKQHISAMPLSPAIINRNLPPAVTMVILRCLAKDPAARFASASNLTVALAVAFNLPVPESLSLSSFPPDITDEPTYYDYKVLQPVISVAPFVAPPPTVRKKHLRVGITLLMLLFLVLTSSGLGTWLWLTRQNTNTASLTKQVVGQAFFVSSGQINENSSQGINDELQINLQNIPAPASGKSYYAWLLSDIEKPMKSLLLGRPPVNLGKIKFHYPGDLQHDSLIAHFSRLLITEENISSVPGAPSSDHRTWRYYAELPQTPSHALDHLRNLLYEGSILQKLKIHGGLNIQLLKHTQKVCEWINSARDSWGSQAAALFIHLQVVRTLDYLDGTWLIQNDVPPGTPLLVDNPLLAQVPLVNIVKNHGNSSYGDRTYKQLLQLSLSPGHTPEMYVIASKDYHALSKYVQAWLENVRTDAIHLVKMSDAKLLQPSTLPILDDMVTQVNDALYGRLDPTTNEVQPGVVQIYYDIQHLATFNVMPYTSQK